ncbi:MAG: hypothetical protein FWG08_04180 [Propionibacteriaceae bacterium]|nr:hypothetical protein [Propionibacteriaceae bacterium]
MKKILGLGLILCVLLAACSKEEEPDITIPPQAPTKSMGGAVFPIEVGDYTVLGPDPVPQQLSVTYAHNNSPLDLVVVSFDFTGEFQGTNLRESQWYGTSRCGILWKSNAQKSPPPQQVACITMLTDGVMTSVSGGQQSVFDIAELANAIERTLPG